MITLGALGLILAMAIMAFCAGGILVGSARSGETLHLRAWVKKLEDELALRPRPQDMEALRAAHDKAVAQVIAMADGAAHARLNPRPAAVAEDIAAPNRTYSPTELRERGDFGEIVSGDQPLGTDRVQTEEEIKAEFEMTQSEPAPER